MVEKEKSDKVSVNFGESITLKRIALLKNYKEEIKMKRLHEKTRRSGIRASSAPNKSFSPIESPPPVDFKRLFSLN